MRGGTPKNDDGASVRPRAPRAQGPGAARPQSMSDTNDRDTRKKGRTKAPELKLVGIDYNVGPDAEDRLRRIFTILLEHTAAKRQAATEKDAPADAVFSENQAGEEA